MSTATTLFTTTFSSTRTEPGREESGQRHLVRHDGLEHPVDILFHKIEREQTRPGQVMLVAEGGADEVLCLRVQAGQAAEAHHCL